jgi:phosphodiesterase/alkaline phosphatase D-like protein
LKFSILFLCFFCALSVAIANESAFETGIRLAKAGKGDEAKKEFNAACEQNHAASCELIGRPVDENTLNRIGIVQGVTDTKSTQLALLHKDSEPLQILLWNLATSKPVASSFRRDFKRAPSPWVVTQIKFEGLEPSLPYLLQVLRKKEELMDSRILSSLDLSRTKVRFAVASCMDDAFEKEQKGMWTDLIDAKPQAIFLIGDNVYADRDGKLPLSVADPKTLWIRYVETRALLEIYRMHRLTPIFAVWDDHDYGINDGDRNHPYKKESLETFRAFFPQEPLAGTVERGPGTSSRLIAFGQEFYFLDDRSFRSPVGTDPQTHWGKEQEEWLFRYLSHATHPAWLLNGDQYFGGYHKFESYEGRHPKSFKDFLTRLRKVKVPFVLVSGDRHLTELMELKPTDVGTKTYEITTSAIHAKTFANAWKDTPNPRQIAGESGVFNYAVFEADASKGLNFRVTAYGPQKRVLFAKDLTVGGR